jgi:tetratricopeptide (TPR) repeat protein
VRDDDPPELKKMLNGYGQLALDERLALIQALAAWADETGLQALGRIVRFEPSTVLSKIAALALLETRPLELAEPLTAEARDRRAEIVRRCLGASTRPAARWVQVQLLSTKDPQAALEKWQEVAHDEEHVLAEHPERSQRSFILAIMRHQVRTLKTLQRNDDALATMMRMAELESSESRTLMDFVEWLVQEQAWVVVDAVADRFSARFDEHPLLLYTLAQARAAQGSQDLAEQIAERAFQLPDASPQHHYEAAFTLEKRGLFSWAEREYRHLIGLGLPASQYSLWASASTRLSSLLHDHARDLEAAEVLKAAIAQIDELVAKRRVQPLDRPNRNGSSPNNRQAAPSVRDMLVARMEYYFAVHFGQQGDRAKQREHLELAIQHDPLDADVLIGMFHLPGADEVYRAAVRERIRTAASEFQNQIKQEPLDPTPHNQLAWLVANTEGDFDEALRASQKSLELRPHEASYLDTLAHCYCAKGDYANAVRMQSQAARIEPHTQVIVRQLKVFQDKWREQQSK